MEDLSIFYRTLRGIYKEAKVEKKKRLLDEIIKNKQTNCIFCGQKNEKLCDVCIRDVHKEAPDLERSFFCDLFEVYRSIKEMRRKTVYEYLFKRVGTIFCENNGESADMANSNKAISLNDNNTLLRRLNEFSVQFNSLIIDTFDSKDEKIMFSNFKMKIHKELIKNYFLINLFNKAEVIEEHLYRMKKQIFDSTEIEIEVLNVYKSIYKEI